MTCSLKTILQRLPGCYPMRQSYETNAFHHGSCTNPMNQTSYLAICCKADGDKTGHPCPLLKNFLQFSKRKIRSREENTAWYMQDPNLSSSTEPLSSLSSPIRAHNNQHHLCGRSTTLLFSPPCRCWSKFRRTENKYPR